MLSQSLTGRGRAILLAGSGETLDSLLQKKLGKERRASARVLI